MEVSGQLHAPAALSHDKIPPFPLDRRLSGPQTRSGRDGEEENPFPSPCLESNLDYSARSLVTTLGCSSSKSTACPVRAPNFFELASM
jgi:hypothetical protein